MVKAWLLVRGLGVLFSLQGVQAVSISTALFGGSALKWSVAGDGAATADGACPHVDCDCDESPKSEVAAGGPQPCGVITSMYVLY